MQPETADIDQLTGRWIDLSVACLGGLLVDDAQQVQGDDQNNHHQQPACDLKQAATPRLARTADLE